MYIIPNRTALPIIFNICFIFIIFSPLNYNYVMPSTISIYIFPTR
jgi:hypothetical protein